MKKLYSRLKGFTLVEMIIVVAIIAFLASAALISSFAMRGQLEFRNGYNIVEGIISEARNMALSGESFPDTSDYDQDGILGDDDSILPNGYIVLVADDGINVTAYLYADLFDSAVGVLDPDNDQLIKMVELPENIRLIVDAQTKAGVPTDGFPRDNVEFMYSTPDATFSIVGEVTLGSLQLKLEQVDEEEGETIILRTKYVFLHYLYGIPELLGDSYFP